MNKEEEIQKLHDAVCKQAADDGKLIEAGWLSYKYGVLPKDASRVQVDETRLAFFAGAQHLFGSVMSILEPGSEATENDFRRLTLISEELQRFYLQMKGREA